MANGTEITISSEDKGTIIKGTAKTRTNGTDTVIDINDLSSITITLRDPDGDTTTAKRRKAYRVFLDTSRPRHPKSISSRTYEQQKLRHHETAHLKNRL